MIEKKYTDKQRESFQERLKKRAEKMALDPVFGSNRLERYFEGVGYYYAAGLNFGKLFKSPNASPLISEFQEVMDNVGADYTNTVALVFSRPQDAIYLMISPCWYWVQEIRPLIMINTKALGDMAIIKLEDFLAGSP